MISVFVWSTPINVAQGAIVTASHSNASGSVPGNLADGNRSTFSQIYGNNYGWWQFDLKAIYTVDLAHYEGVSMFYLFPQYKLYSRLNATDSWSLVLHLTNNTSISNDHSFAAVTARYFLFEAWSNYVDPAWTELELYQAASVPEGSSLLLIFLGLCFFLKNRK